jgi:hypothetical protein
VRASRKHRVRRRRNNAARQAHRGRAPPNSSCTLSVLASVACADRVPHSSTTRRNDDGSGIRRRRSCAMSQCTTLPLMSSSVALLSPTSCASERRAQDSATFGGAVVGHGQRHGEARQSRRTADAHCAEERALSCVRRDIARRAVHPQYARRARHRTRRFALCETCTQMRTLNAHMPSARTRAT